MIRVVDDGQYELIKDKTQAKILILDRKKIFEWINITNREKALVTSRKAPKTNRVLSAGKYRLYEVKQEDRFTDLIHLELLVGRGKWKGYLLPNGLPNGIKKPYKIVPTDETITKCIC